MHDYIFQDRAVAFVDVLGFQQKLREFENDVKLKTVEEGEYFVSEKVNEFINTVKHVTSLLDEGNFKYYLFSDNICITVDYLENPDLLISLLFAINELFYSFAQKGYFLRGGIDVGKFVDEKQIALGVPLAKAYIMESKSAVYPRILISEDLYNLIKENLSESKFVQFAGISEDRLIHHNCEFHFLNPFYNVFTKSDKVKFFKDFREKIRQNLELNKRQEQIQIKYQWLADQYNAFLDLYANQLINAEEEIEPTRELVEELKTLKI
ncbi:MAG TPA: hypothetical protein VFR58_04440 [Flavisolibacter sp.]|nr:hypothetical protein [Flavisolibacter sp.]